MTTDPKPPPMSELDHINMAKHALRDTANHGPESFTELIGRFMHNVERIADALERSADALSKNHKPLFDRVEIGRDPR
jgi:hypothetical protein